MSRVYVPWPDRPREYRGWQRRVAVSAVAVYRLVAPLVRSYPGLIFLLAAIVACLGTFAVVSLMHSAWLAREAAERQGVVAAGATLTLAQLGEAARLAGVSAPAALLYPLQWQLVRDLVALHGVVAFVSVLAMFAIWWERKVSAFLQSRLGPMRVGGWHGWSQSLADGIKLLGKEDLVPARADRMLFRIAPYISFVPALAAFIALPFGAYWVFRNVDVALLLVLAMLGLEVLGVLIAGWASNNKWSIFGALREAAQVVAYEIPMGFSLLVPIMVAGTLQLTGERGIAEQQAGGWFNWFAWHSPLTFVAMFTYFIASLAACKRAPFDLPEAESELVAGFHTEYSGFRWSLFFFAEYAAMFVVSGLLVILFLGAWDAPWAGLEAALGSAVGWAWLEGLSRSGSVFDQILHGVLFSGPLWFIAKCMLLIYVQMWLRWTLPRLRIDHVLYSCIQVVLPLSMVVLLACTLWELALRSSPGFERVAGGISAVLGVIGIVLALSIVVVAAHALRRRRDLVGPLGVARPLRGG